MKDLNEEQSKDLSLGELASKLFSARPNWMHYENFDICIDVK